MKVLFVTRKFPPTVGGMELLASDTYGALRRKANIRLIKWGGSNALLPLVLPYFFCRSFLILCTKNIDLLHMQDGITSIIGAVLKIIFNKPLVVVIHGLDVTFSNPVYQRAVKWSLAKADKVICISRSAADEVIKRGIDPRKVVPIPIGTNDTFFYGNRSKARKKIGESISITIGDKPVLLTVGRLVKRKGVEWFIEEALPRIVSKFPNLIYVVVGEGDNRQNISQAIKNKNLSKNVFLLGRVGDGVLRDLYNGADIFVMPNIPVPGDLEGFGLVASQAALCELPVIASGIEGIRDAVMDGKNGILLTAGDSEEYANRVSSLLSKSAELRDFGKQSRIYTLENYSWPAIADKYIGIYKTLI